VISSATARISSAGGPTNTTASRARERRARREDELGLGAIEARGRLVENEHAGLEIEGARDRDLAARPGRSPRGRSTGEIEADARERPRARAVDPRDRCRGRPRGSRRDRSSRRPLSGMP
jgi:hypothetical protein